MPYIKIELTIFEKSFAERDYSKSFIVNGLKTPLINRTLAKKTLLTLLHALTDYNRKKKNV
jgi:hypothetical protein